MKEGVIIGKISKGKLNAIKTLVFYALAIIAIVLINISGEFKSGPCTPNLDFFSILFLCPVSFVFMMINAVKTFTLNRETKYSFYIHLIFLIPWVYFLFYYWFK